MTPLERCVEAVNANLPEYLPEEIEGRDSDDVFLPYWRRFELGDIPDTDDRIILAGEEVAGSRRLIRELHNRVSEHEVELRRRSDIISKLVLALENSNQIAAKLTDILAKSVKP